jgi:NFACT N-terminal and middle domains
MRVESPTKSAKEVEFERQVTGLRRKARSAVAKYQRLLKNLQSDIEKHGDPEKWKRFGDLLLANTSNAMRKDDRITVTDYFDESTPEIEIEDDTQRRVTATKSSQKGFRKLKFH